jgi:hypothetical protein
MSERARSLWRTLSGTIHGRHVITVAILLIVSGAIALIARIIMSFEQ